MKKKLFYGFMAAITLYGMLTGCNSERRIVYMQDAADQATERTEVNRGIVIQPKDIMSVVVSSKTPELATALNLPLHSYQAGSTGESESYSQRLLGYLVDMDGNIDFPVLGKIKAAGLTREELSTVIQDRLRNEGLLKDAMVTAELMNFKISVLGEVRTPGTFDVKDDRITLLEALARAGDLNIYARRDNVLVRREQEGKAVYYRVDLRSMDFTRSAAFYLQQNDVVYVSTNRTGAGQEHINENTSLSTWVSLASFLMSLAVLIINVK